MICNRLKECVEECFAGCAPSECVNRKSDCIQSCDKRSQVTCIEKNKRYTYLNTRGVDVVNYHMDGGVIKQDRAVPQGTVKCDHVIVVRDERPTAIFVELKGTDVIHALEQIRATIQRECALVNVCAKIYARIVMMSSAPKIQTTREYMELYKLILRSGGGNIKLGTLRLEERDTELIG